MTALDRDDSLFNAGAMLTPKFTLSQKIIQGLGGVVYSARGAVYVLILFYYNSILGIPSYWVGAALALTVLIDAITDPIVGSWSDNTTSSLGRRHPFMYASMVPLGLGLFFILAPPDSLGQSGLLFWIFFWGSFINVSFTLFQIPYSSMIAELTDNYDERTKLTTYRYMSTLIGAVMCEVVIYRFFLPDTAEFPQGQFNPEGYPTIGLAAAVFAVIMIFITTHFTRNRIQYLPKAAVGARLSFRGIFNDTKDVLSNRNFRLLFLGILIVGMSLGATENLLKQMIAFFWALTSEQQGMLSLCSALAAMFAVLGTAFLQKHFEKKTLIVIAFATYTLIEVFMVSGRFLEVIPANGTDALFYLLVVTRGIRLAAVLLAAIYFGSLLGDIVLEHEYNSGRRQSGSMFAGLGFSEKAVEGLGVLLTGFLLHFTGLPAGQLTSAVDATPEQIRNLGIAYGFVIPAMGILPLFLVSRIDLTRAKFTQISQALEARKLRARTEMFAPS